MFLNTSNIFVSFFREVMTSLSDFLGEKPYLLGKEPCLADLSMFGFVTMVRI